MFIKTFEDVRKFIIEHTHIDLMVDYGLDRVNLFGPGILLDATWYVLSKNKKNVFGLFFNITDNQQEKHKKDSFEKAYDDILNNHKNDRTYTLDQSKLKIIEGWPFIYWISDGFREKFRGRTLDLAMKVCAGISTANNIRFVRFWWELNVSAFYENGKVTKDGWVVLYKGGPSNKWFGNIWLKINWKNDGLEIKNFEAVGKAVRNEQHYFKNGITLAGRSSSKGTSFLFMGDNGIFDIGAAAIIPVNDDTNQIYSALAILNSSLIRYVIESLNPTVNTTEGDLKKIPFPCLKSEIAETLITLVSKNIEIKKHLYSFHIIETNFEKTPLTAFLESTLRDKVLAYLNNENAHLTQVLINEAFINKLIFEVYELSPEDRLQVETKMGKPVGELPVLTEAVQQWITGNGELAANEEVKEFVKNLAVTTFDETKIREIKEDFKILYQSHSDLEEFCIRHQVNPINIWYWFKEARVLPSARAAEIALEFLADAIRSILAEDEDGIIPLVGLPGEPRLLDRLEKYCLANGLTPAQFGQLDGLLGRPLNEYLEHHFFKDLSDHLNLFMYLPKTPFIWHLSSGGYQGLELFITIYKWNKDSLYKLKMDYIRKRVERLEFRQIQLKDSTTAQAQNEKENLRFQLQEIAGFSKKIEELLAEGYHPKLDDGVGKNIAPLQKKGMLRCDVLNPKQLEKYLKADW